MSAAGRTLPQRHRDPLAALTAPRVLPSLSIPQLSVLRGGRA